MGAILFGKLPAHGDFVSRGLSAPARDDLDAWLSESLAAARDALGDAFDDRFVSAPPWRFAWDETREGWTAGALAPSVDASGRRYPLLLARTGIAADAVGPAALGCEDALYAALAEGWTADRALVEVEADPGSADEAVAEGWWLADGDGAVTRRLPERRPAGLLTAMLTVPAIAA